MITVKAPAIPRCILACGVVAVALLHPADAPAGFFDRGADSDILSLLALMPAPESEEGYSFAAHDLAAMRDRLGLDWPEAWPEPGSGEARDTVTTLLSYMTPPPDLAMSLFDLDGSDRYPYPIAADDPYVAIGLSALSFDGLIESYHSGISVVVGKAFGELGTIAPALGTPDGGDGTYALWRLDDELPWGNFRWLLAVPPDTAALQRIEPDVAQTIEFYSGDRASLAELAPVSALLEVLDGAEAANGHLLSLWASHSSALMPIRLRQGGWPQDAALPEYELVGCGHWLDGSEAVGALALVYADAATAHIAETEMSRRLPVISESLGEPVHDLTLRETQAGPTVVVITARWPTPIHPDQPGRLSPYHAWMQMWMRTLSIPGTMPSH